MHTGRNHHKAGLELNDLEALYGKRSSPPVSCFAYIVVCILTKSLYLVRKLNTHVACATIAVYGLFNNGTCSPIHKWFVITWFLNGTASLLVICLDADVPNRPLSKPTKSWKSPWPVGGVSPVSSPCQPQMGSQPAPVARNKHKSQSPKIVPPCTGSDSGASQVAAPSCHQPPHAEETNNSTAGNIDDCTMGVDILWADEEFAEPATHNGGDGDMASNLPGCPHTSSPSLGPKAGDEDLEPTESEHMLFVSVRGLH